MSDLPLAPPPGRQRELAVTDALADLDAELTRLRAALPLVNDETLRPTLDQLATFATTAGQVLAQRGDGVDQRLVDELADLAGTLDLVQLPSRDPDLGFTSGLDAVGGAQGRCLLILRRALRAAQSLGLHPSRPALADALAAEVPRALFDGQLDAIAKQLDAVAERLDALDKLRRDAPASVREGEMVVFYLGAMRVELNLARLALTLGVVSVDFATLARATEAMATLTGDFLATLRAWAARASAAIRDGVEQVRGTVRRVVTVMRDTARSVVARAAGGTTPPLPTAPEPPPAPPTDAAPPPGFSVAAARALILAGQTVPTDWVPFLTELDFAGTELADLSPLAGLTALRSLGLGWNYIEDKELNATKVTDLSPLAGLTALQRLDLWNTQVRDVSALAGLTALQSLNLTGTRVSDVSPLAGLTALRNLNLWGTPVSDVSALAGLTALQSLDLDGTRVSDVSALAGLTALQSLDLRNTPVSDVSALAGLTALQSLNLRGTPVSDVSALAGLTALQSLDLMHTRVSDVSPLAGLTALQRLDLAGTQVSDVSALAGLTALQSLDLRNTPVSDVSPLAGLTALRRLDLTGSQVKDVSALKGVNVEIRGGPPPPPGLLNRLLRRPRKGR